MELKAQDLKNINGGGIGLALAIGAGIIFLIGVIDGYVRPYKCR